MALIEPCGVDAWAPMPWAVRRASPSPAGSTSMRSAGGSVDASARTTAVASPATALPTVPPSKSTITSETGLEVTVADHPPFSP